MTAGIDRSNGSLSMGARRVVSSALWILFLAAAFFVYSHAFSSFRILEKKTSILGDADSANFSILIKDFHLSQKYGNEYNTLNRSPGDIAQKHKIHHILYVFCASIIYKAFALFYGFFGISQNDALYSVNAFIACVNIVLLYGLLKSLNPDGIIFPYLIFYAASLTTLIYSSVPESWPFSATLILLFITLSRRTSNWYVLSGFIGIAMLNNITLASLIAFLLVSYLKTPVNVFATLKKSLYSFCIMLATWFTCLSFLSLFDKSLSPVNFIRYTIWFKKFVSSGLTLYDPYAWKVVLTNLFINSIVSNQGNPKVPPESLLYTFKESTLGSVATGLYLVLVAVVFFGIYRFIKNFIENKKSFTGLLMTEEISILFYCILWVFITVLMFPQGAFLYSTCIVPLLIATIYRFIKPKNIFLQALAASTICLVIINNIDQVLKFRRVLGHLM